MEISIVMSKMDKKIFTYILITFLATWFFWFISLVNISEVWIRIGTFVPSTVGIIMTYKYYGRESFYHALKSLVAVKFKIKWYVYTFSIMPIVILLAYLGVRTMGNTAPSVQFPIQVIPLVFGYIMLFMGPLGEEAGWRGFLLKQLVNRFKLFDASLILGIVWAVWHLPLFILNNTIQSQLASTYGFVLAFIGYLVYTVALTIQVSILFINTKCSVFGAILYHSVANTSLGMMPLVLTRNGALALIICNILITTILTFYNKKVLFSKGLYKCELNRI